MQLRLVLLPACFTPAFQISYTRCGQHRSNTTGYSHRVRVRGRLGASPKKSLYLQIGIEPGQLIAVARREAVDQVLGVAEVGQAVYGVIWARVVPAHLVLHHGIHAHGILPVTSGVEGAVAWVWRTRGVDGKWREHTHTYVRGSILNGQLTIAQPQTHKTRERTQGV